MPQKRTKIGKLKLCLLNVDVSVVWPYVSFVVPLTVLVLVVAVVVLLKKERREALVDPSAVAST